MVYRRSEINGASIALFLCRAYCANNLHAIAHLVESDKDVVAQGDAKCDRDGVATELAAFLLRVEHAGRQDILVVNEAATSKFAEVGMVAPESEGNSTELHRRCVLKSDEIAHIIPTLNLPVVDYLHLIGHEDRTNILVFVGTRVIIKINDKVFCLGYALGHRNPDLITLLERPDPTMGSIVK